MLVVRKRGPREGRSRLEARRPLSCYHQHSNISSTCACTFAPSHARKLIFSGRLAQYDASNAMSILAASQLPRSPSSQFRLASLSAHTHGMAGHEGSLGLRREQAAPGIMRASSSWRRQGCWLLVLGALSRRKMAGPEEVHHL